jgi:hypothetical protein
LHEGPALVACFFVVGGLIWTSQATFLLGAWLRRLLPWARSPAGAAKRPDAGGAAPCGHGRSYPSARSSACPPLPRASWRTLFGYPLARGSTSLSLGFRGSRRCKAGPASPVAPAADCPSASQARNTRERTRRPSPTRSLLGPLCVQKLCFCTTLRVGHVL